jgi:hypothetical protein
MQLASTVFILSLVAADPLLGQALPASALTSYNAIRPEERLRWFAVSTVGPQSLAAGVVSSAWATAFNNPPEYGPTWEGFGKRYGMRLTGVSTGNAIEAGLGAAWGEDPRYFRAETQAFWGRVRHVVKMTFVAPRRDGGIRPAYARYAGVVGNNVLSNAWRVDSQTSADDTLIRCVVGVAGRMASNAFAEFLPDVIRRFSRGNKLTGTPDLRGGPGR